MKYYLDTDNLSLIVFKKQQEKQKELTTRNLTNKCSLSFSADVVRSN